jgi:hypothetical protein
MTWYNPKAASTLLWVRPDVLSKFWCWHLTKNTCGMSEVDRLNAVLPETDEETLAFTSTTRAAHRMANNPKQMAFKRYRHGTFIIGGCIQK